MRDRLKILLILLLTGNTIFAQTTITGPGTVTDIVLRTSQGDFSRSFNSILKDNQDQLWFYYDQKDEVALVDLLEKDGGLTDSLFSLVPSGDFEIIDPFAVLSDSIVRAKIRFTNLSNNNFLQLKIKTNLRDTSILETVPLLPLTRTQANFFPKDEEWFLGEEKVFEIVSNKPDNIAITTDWIRSGNFDYRVDRKFDQLNLHIVPKRLGKQKLDVQLKAVSPYMNEAGKLSYELPVISKEIKILQSRLAYLSTYTEEVIFNAKNRKEGIEVQVDDSPRLKPGRTYRLENQEEPGGALIAELYTKSRLSNNRMLCILRVYNLHRSMDGYLYIKDYDEPLHLTNFTIAPEMQISGIQLLKEGNSWTSNLNVYPGETVEVKVNGEGLLKAGFVWDNATDLSTDSTLRTDNVAYFRLKIPTNINTNRVALFNKGNDTGKGLNVKEYQEPRNFDFVTVNYGMGDRSITNLGGPVIYDKVIKDILIDFNYNKIDSEHQLYGKQYMEVEVKITGKNRELIELKTIPVFGVCPGEMSPRHPYYYKKDCVQAGISLNKYLSTKTYDLDDWVRIELTFKHASSKYESPGMVQTAEFIVQKPYRFDVDVSFPAGLIINRFGDDSGAFDNFGGISMAMIAQFSFYDQERIGKFKPYKVGAGFLALNAFNFNEGVNRDVAIVVLGSLYPTRKDAKLTFPLYMGGGRFLGSGDWFILLGPGIRVSL